MAKKKKVGRIILFVVLGLVAVLLVLGGIFLSKILGMIEKDPTESLIPRPDSVITYENGDPFDGDVLTAEYYSDDKYSEEEEEALPSVYTILKSEFADKKFCLSVVSCMTADSETVVRFEELVELSVAVPVGMNGEKCKVYSVDKNGTLYETKSSFNGTLLSLKTKTLGAFFITEDTVMAEPHPHIFTEWEQIDEETHSRYCYCGEEEIQSHRWKETDGKQSATHLAEGHIVYVCEDCGATKTEALPRITEHTFSDWTPVDENKHERVCECGETETQGHTWNDGVITVEANHLHDGEKVYTCDFCGKTKTESIPRITEHSFGDWENYDVNTHRKNCECGEYIEEKHTWDDGNMTVVPTPSSEGLIVYTCTKCGAVKNEVVPAGEHIHTYLPWINNLDGTHTSECSFCHEVKTEEHTWDDGEIVEPATHLKEGSAKYVCTKCGAEKTETIPKLSAHNFGDYESMGAEEHQRICECGETETEKHAWNAGEITKPATHTEEGVMIYICTKCGEVREERIPKTVQHTFTDYKKVDADTHIGTCECGETVTEAHVWDAGKVTKKATHLEAGEKVYTCTKCSATKKEIIAKITTHTYTNWTSISEEQHTGTCECGNTLTEGHKWNSGEKIKEATVSEGGEIKYTCTKCGYTKIEKTAPLPDMMNILLLGIDSGRSGTTDYKNFSGRSDTMMILSIDFRANKMSLTSFMRDLRVPAYNSSNKYQGISRKLTEVFALYGGAKATEFTLEHYFDIDIDYYVCINIAGMRTILDKLGTIDMELSSAEAKELGLGTEAGKYELNSYYASAFARIRYVDNDRGRTLRQGKVLQAYLDKFKTAPLTDLLGIMMDCIDCVKTNMSISVMTKVATGVYNCSASGFDHDSYPKNGFLSYNNYIYCKECGGCCTQVTVKNESGKDEVVYKCESCGHIYRKDPKTGKYGLSDLGYLAYEKNKDADFAWFRKRIFNYGI